MTGTKDVVSFLKDFHYKLDFWGVYYLERDKNFDTLLLLEFTKDEERKKILKSLTEKDYCEGPIREVAYNGSDMWVFGKNVKGHEIYIKISMGMPSDKVLCISFHIAEYQLIYPYKN